MPQDNQNPGPQVPGSDVLLDTLRRSKLTDDQRQNIWDAYHKPADEKSFVQSMRGLDVNDDVRQTMYDMRFKGFKNLPTNQANNPDAPQGQMATPAPVTKVQGDVRPSNQDVLAKSTGIGPTSPSFGDRFMAMITGGAPSGSTLGRMSNRVAQPSDSQQEGSLVKFEDFHTPVERAQHPIVTGVEQLASGFTSAPNLLIAAGTAGFGALPGAVGAVAPRLLSGVFGTQMLQQAPQQYRDMKAAYDRKDYGEAERLATIWVGTQAMAFGAGKHAIESGPTSFQTQQEQIREQSIQQMGPRARSTGSDRNLNDAVQNATPLPRTATDLGHRDSSAQQLQLDFTTKAPTEAHAPVDQGGASKSSNAPVVDRQALIAPNPADYVGKDAPVGLHRFPSSAIENLARGRTLGVDKFVPSFEDSNTSVTSPSVPRTDEPVLVNSGTTASRATSPTSDGMKPIQYSTDNNGTRWAKSGDLDITIPASLGDASVPEYARLKLKEQEELRKQGEYGKFKANQSTDQSTTPKGPTSFELPQSLRDNFDRITKLSRDADLAESESHLNELNKRKTELGIATRDMLHEHMRQLNGDQLAQLRESSTKEAEHLEAQSKAIHDLTDATIRNKGIKQEIVDKRLPGGKSPHELVAPDGSRILVRPEDSQVGMAARRALDEAQGRVPNPSTRQIDITRKPEGMSDEELENYVDKLQTRLRFVKDKIHEQVTLASHAGASLAEMDIDRHIQEMNDLDSELSRYTTPGAENKTGRRPSIAPELDEHGAIKSPEPLKMWTRERARLALGTKLKAMPTEDEFYQHADMRAEKAGLHRTVAEEAQKLLDTRKSQGGVLGEVGVKGQVKRVSLADQVPDDKELLRRALQARIFGVTVDDQFGAGEHGFLSKDGKTWIDTGRMTHDAVAETLMPEVSKNGSALRAMLDKGWVRKADYTNYEARNLDGKSFATIDMDLTRSGRYGQAINIDTMKPNGRPGTISLEDGWGDRFPNVREASEAFIRKGGWTSEQGAIKGTTLALSSTLGGVAGHAIGAHIGDPYLGSAIGWGLGFVTPAVLDHPLMRNAFSKILPQINRLGISSRAWFKGPEQLPLNSPLMESIIDDQRRDLKGPSRSYVQRLAQLPADTWVKFRDPLLFINDRPGAVVKFLTQWDSRTKPFFDLRGKLDVDNSPVVTAALSAGQASGEGSLHLLDYRNIISDAFKAQVYPHLISYLNLAGYQRAYDVAGERINNAHQDIQRLTQALQQPNLPVEVEAGLRRNLRDTKSELAEVMDKVTKQTLVPKQINPKAIQTELTSLQQTLGPDKFKVVQDAAQKVYDLNRKVLDQLHDGGIVGDDDYKTYTARGDAYIPMQRIFEKVFEGTKQTYASNTPYYLRQQGVIHALSGSERTNIDPIQASADANLEGLREVYRNNVLRDYLKLAAVEPSIGSLFKKVSGAYQPKIDEGLIGYYENGTQHTFAVPSYMAESFKGTSPIVQDATTKIARFFSSVMRRGATAENLAWSLPNAARHFQDMALMSEAGLKSVKTLPKDAAGLLNDWRKTVHAVYTQDSTWRGALRAGALAGVQQRAISPEEHLDPGVLGSPFRHAGTHILNTVENFNKAVEDVTKLTTYTRLRQAGYSEKAAAWETRRYGGGPDFSQAGTQSGAANLAFMFFNAKLNYVSRAFARMGENPARIIPALTAITAMSMALSQWNWSQKDENGEPLMRRIMHNDKENNWVVLTPWRYKSTGDPIKMLIPKGSFLKFIANPIENTINKLAGHEDRSGTQLGLQIINNLVPGQVSLEQGEVGKSAARGLVSSLNPVLRTPAEEMMNYQTSGEGGSIVPGFQTGLSPALQFRQGTSTMARNMGQGGLKGAIAGGAEGATIGALLYGTKGAALGGALGSAVGAYGVSPERAEHVIDTTTAGAGRIATGFVDPFLGGVKQTRMGQDKITNTPVVGPLVSRFLGSSQNQREVTAMHNFYRDAGAAAQIQNDLAYKSKNDPASVPAFLEQHKDDLWKAKLGVELQQKMSVILSTERALQQIAGDDSSSIAESLKNIRAVKLQLLDTFNSVLNQKPWSGQTAANPGQGQGGAR